jgi:hypothetical protein
MFTICVSLNDIDDGISPVVRCEEFIECITKKINITMIYLFFITKKNNLNAHSDRDWKCKR